MDKALETELRTYEQHREHLLGTAEGKFVLIRNEELVGVYEETLQKLETSFHRDPPESLGLAEDVTAVNYQLVRRAGDQEWYRAYAETIEVLADLMPLFAKSQQNR